MARHPIAMSVTAVLVVVAAGVGISAASGNAAPARPRGGKRAATLPGSKSGAGPRFHLVPRVTSTSQACEYTIGPLPEGSTSSITAAQAFAAFPFAAAELTDASATGTVEFAGVSAPAYGPVVNGKVKPYYSDTAEWVVIFTNVPTSFLNRGPSTHRMPTTGSLGSLVDPSSGLNNGLSSC